MAGHHPWSVIEKELGPQRCAQIERSARTTQEEMFLAEMRRLMDLTRQSPSGVSDAPQANTAPTEQQTEMPISSLRHIIEAMGGTLEIIAHLPGGDIAIKLGTPPKQDAA